MEKEKNEYGAIVETGIVVKEENGGYIVDSLSRIGIRSRSIGTITGAELEAGERVCFSLFPDGRGIIFR